MNLDSRIYHLDSKHSFSEFFKYDTLSSSFVQQKIGDINSEDFIRNISSIWVRRSNLSNVHLGIIYGDYPPLTWKGNSPEDVRGFFGEIFFALHEKLQFQYTIYHQEDGVWGTLQEDGSFSGLFGKIQRGEVNWSIADTTITLERSEFVDFSIPVMQQHRKLVTRKPNEDFEALSYLNVFSTEFWIALVIFGVALLLCLFGILAISRNHHEPLPHCLNTAFAYTMCSLLGRELFSLNTNLSGKILCFVLVIWGFLVSASYNAILTSVLASSVTVKSIDSLEDLLMSKDYTLILKSDGFIRDYFAKAAENTTGKILNSNFMIAETSLFCKPQNQRKCNLSGDVLKKHAQHFGGIWKYNLFLHSLRKIFKCSINDLMLLQVHNAIEVFKPPG